MFGTVRGVFTLVGAGIAGLLVWVSTQVAEGTTGGYWAVYGLVAGAGLTMAAAQLLGGWTKWGVPRLSAGVLLIGFLPVLVCAGWVLLAGQPDANWFQRHVVNWSSDIGIAGLVDDLREYLGVLAFGVGLTFGFTLDTRGPAVERQAATPLPRRVGDEPLDAEETTVLEPEPVEEPPERVPVRVPAAD